MKKRIILFRFFKLAYWKHKEKEYQEQVDDMEETIENLGENQERNDRLGEMLLLLKSAKEHIETLGHYECFINKIFKEIAWHIKIATKRYNLEQELIAIKQGIVGLDGGDPTYSLLKRRQKEIEDELNPNDLMPSADSAFFISQVADDMNYAEQYQKAE